MSKITEYEVASAFDANDVLLKDGENGTMIISVEDAASEFKRLGGIDDDISGINQSVTQAMDTITSNIAGVETDYIASKDYAIGDLFVVNNVLYKATAAIAEEDVIDTEINCAVVNLGDEIGDIRSELANKANVDGSYSTLTAGNAEQLVGTVFTEDDAAYTFRTAGGSADIGDREYDEIVGGSIVWNQMAPAIDEWRSEVSTISVDDGVATITYAGTNQAYFGLRANITITPNHKLYICADTDVSGIAASDYIGLQIQGTVSDHVNYFGTLGLDKISGVWNATYGLSAIKLFAQCRGLTESDSFTIKNIQLFDLTQMFGSEIADYIYNLEQTTPGAGVAWFRKYFPKDYYEYNAGELMHVSDLQSHDMVGFNAWDEEWEDGEINANSGADTINPSNWKSKNYIPIIPGASYYAYSPTAEHKTMRCRFYDAEKKYIGYTPKVGETYTDRAFTPPDGAYYMRFAPYISDIPNHDICINLSWDGERDGEYEPYVKHSYPLDSSLTLRGIPKLSTDGKLYYDGDHYKSDGTVERRYGIVDLGTVTWTKVSLANDHWRFWAYLPTLDYTGSLLCTKYDFISATETYTGSKVGIARQNNPTAPQLLVFDEAYTDAATFKEAMSGVYLVYELAEPTTEEAQPFQSPQIVDDFGTEEYVTSSIVPVGHITQYDSNLRAKLEMAPNSPDGDGDYLVRQTGGQNEYVPYTDGGRITALEGKIPAAPSANGSYILKCTVTDGTATYAWVAE